jgi:Arc/MetJ family transcription regulator
MTRTIIDTDDELLERAKEILGTTTKKDTVNAALRQVVAFEAGRQFLEDAKAGKFDELARPGAREAMWQR